MKIAVLSSHTQSLFWFCIDMMIELVGMGHEVVAVGHEDEDKWREKLMVHGIKYKQIPVSRTGVNPISDLKTLRALDKFMEEFSPDKIFAYHAKTIIYGSEAARRHNITEFYTLLGGLGSVFRGSGFKNKLIRAVMSAQYRRACSYSKTVMFQNNDDRQVFIDKKIVSLDKTVIINGSGVNTERFAESEMPENTAFLFIGRLIRDKGLFEYLEACRILKKKYKETKCYLMGPFDVNPTAVRREDIEPYMEDGTVEYLGEKEDVRPGLRDCSVFVLPSYHEGTPKTILEAMSMGRAIITSDAPGCRETVKNGLNGFLLPVKDIQAIAEKMMYFVENKGQAELMGRESRRIAEEKYDVRLINRATFDVMGL